MSKRASGVSIGIIVHQDYCAVWLPNKALCIRRRFSNEVAYLLERGGVGVSVRARISRCKIKKNLAHPTRFERVTFAFEEQWSLCASRGIGLRPIASTGVDRRALSLARKSCWQVCWKASEAIRITFNHCLGMMNHDCACRWAASGMFVHETTMPSNTLISRDS